MVEKLKHVPELLSAEDLAQDSSAPVAEPPVREASRPETQPDELNSRSEVKAKFAMSEQITHQSDNITPSDEELVSVEGFRCLRRYKFTILAFAGVLLVFACGVPGAWMHVCKDESVMHTVLMLAGIIGCVMAMIGSCKMADEH